MDASYTPLIALASAIAGASMGTLGAYLSGRGVEAAKRKLTQQAVAYQIYAELHAFFDLQDELFHMRIILDIKDTMHLQEGWRYHAHIGDNLFPIYKANVENIALLPPILQRDIVLVYSILTQLFKNLKQGGVLDNANTTKHDFEQVLKRYDMCVDLANKIISKLGKLHPAILQEP